MRLRELARRLGSLDWILSQARDAVLGLWARSVSRAPFASCYRLVHDYSMAGPVRLRGLHRAVLDVVRRDIPGDVVECGTARGGSAALMGLTLRHCASERTLWVFDTFRGLPPPTDGDPDVAIARHYTGTCRGEIDEVRGLFARLGVLEHARLVEGLFEDTVPTSAVEKIAVLHLDGDWYESVKVCLEHLYDRVSPGGIIQIDDYGHWEGARRAVDEFLHRRGLGVELEYLDYTGRQFVKP